MKYGRNTTGIDRWIFYRIMHIEEREMRKLSFVTMVLLLGALLHGAMLKNIPMTITQPDGTTFECLASGDEYFNYLHDENGYTIIQSQDDGFYYYAAMQNNAPVASAYRVNEVNPASAGLEPGTLISKEEYLERRSQKESSMRDGDRMNSIGIVQNLVVYIRFADQSEFDNPRTYFDAKFNGDDNSLGDYYDEVSYGQMEVLSTHYPVCETTTNLSYQDSHPRRYYSPYNQVTNPEGYQNSGQYSDREHQLLVNAINYIADEVPEDLVIDNDNDGKVDNVCFIIRGGNDSWADLLWAHRWMLFSYTVYVHGKRVYDYTFQPETQNEVSTLCHEMFHSVGAPDLYHYNGGSFESCGVWDIMDGGSAHMGAYMKYMYSDWISEIPEISAHGTYYLNSLLDGVNNCFKIPSPNCSTEYFVLEYRRKVPGTYENMLPSSGLVVYRINSLYEGQGNASGPPDEVYIYRPGGTTSANGNLNQAPFSEENGRRSISDETNPSCFLSNGDPGGLFIHQAGSCDDQISFILYPELGYLSGVVSANNGDPDLTQVQIVIDDFIMSPGASGGFSVPYYEGTYEVTALLDGYAPATATAVIPPNGFVDIELNLDFLAPPFNLDRTLDGNDVHMTWSFDNEDDENFTHYAIYIKATSQNFAQFATTTDCVYDVTLSPVLDYAFQVRAIYDNGTSAPSNTIYISYVDNDDPTAPPVETALNGNHPNPFNPTTEISFSLKDQQQVKLEVFNLKGQLVKTLVNDKMQSGNHTVTWTGDDNHGKKVGSGVYFYRIKAGRYVSTKKMIMLK